MLPYIFFLPFATSCPSSGIASTNHHGIFQTLASLDTYFLHRFEPLLGLMFGSMFPCHPSLWNKPEGRQTWIDHYNAGHEEARRLVSPDKRLEFLIQEGWAPLCEFLGVQVPLGDDGEPLKFPHFNDTETFGAKLAVVKRQAVVRIAKRWSPLLGNHWSGGYGYLVDGETMRYVKHGNQ